MKKCDVLDLPSIGKDAPLRAWVSAFRAVWTCYAARGSASTAAIMIDETTLFF